MTGRVRQMWPSIVIATLVLMVVTASDAAADPAWDLNNVLFGQSNPALTPFIQFSDSHGINVWQYELSIDRGNPVTGADKWFWTKFVDPLWQLYRDIVLVSVWLIRWVLEFGWMGPVSEAATAVNIALSSVMDRLGLVGLFLTIAGVVGAYYIVKGRIATGVWEMVLACVVVAGLSTFLANPAGLILNTNGGAAYMARDTSLEFVAAMSQTPELGASAQIDQITASLIETFIRQPLQLANFGVVLDGGPCEPVYDEVVKSGPHAWGSEIRDKINGCNAKVGEYAGTPSPSMATSLLFMYVGALVVLAFALIIAGAVLKAGVSMAYLAVKSAVTVVVAVLPGAARRPFWGTIADLIVAIGVFLFSYVALAAFLQGVDLVLGATPDMPATQRLIIMDILLIVLLILFLINKKRIEQSANKLRELLATRPGGSVGAGSPAPKLNTAMAVSAAANVAHLARDLMKGRKKTPPQFNWANDSNQPPLGAGIGGFAGGGFHSPRPGRGAVPSGGFSGAARQVVAAGAQVALAHVTGGASKVITAGYQLARLSKPKPRPQLPSGSGSNPAIRNSQSSLPRPAGRPPLQLAAGRRPLEITTGADRPPAPGGGGGQAGGGPRRPGPPSQPPGQGTGPYRPEPPNSKPGGDATGGAGSVAATPPARKPARPRAGWGNTAGGVPVKPSATPVPQQLRRPVRRPQGPRGR